MSSWIKKIGDRTREALAPLKKESQPGDTAAGDTGSVDASGLDFVDPSSGQADAEEKPGSLIAQLAGLNPNESAFIDSGYDPERGPQNLLREIEDSIDAPSVADAAPAAKQADALSGSMIARYSEQAEALGGVQERAAAPQVDEDPPQRATGPYRDLNLEFDDDFGAVTGRSPATPPSAGKTVSAAAQPDDEDSIEHSLSTVKLDVEDLDLGPAADQAAEAAAAEAQNLEDSIERSLSTVKLDVEDLDLGFVAGEAAPAARSPAGEPAGRDSQPADPPAEAAVTDPELPVVVAPAATESAPPSAEQDEPTERLVKPDPGQSPAAPVAKQPAAAAPPVAEKSPGLPQAPAASDGPPPSIARDDDVTQVGLSPSLGQDTVTGWLVVTEGPGKGLSRPLGIGINAVGRAPDNRVPLYLGGRSDGEISRRDHLRVIYDPKGNSFSVQHGSSRNLSYLNDKPLYETVALKAHDRITVGKTTLLFVPLCGDDFQW